MNVRIIYHPYAEIMSIFIDGQSIGMISALSKYQSQPFEMWCSLILSAVATEVNDNFELTYVGRKCEYEVLQHHMKECPNCTKIYHEEPALPDTALQRLKKLNRMISSGVVCNNFSETLHVYSDLDPTEIENTVRLALPRLSYCRFNVTVEPLSAVKQEKERNSAIAIIKGGSVAPNTISQNVFGSVYLGGVKSGCINGMFVLSGDRSTLSEDISKLMELGYFPRILKEGISRTERPASIPLYYELYVLDKTEPQVIASLPRNIEVGEVTPIQVHTVPADMKAPEITCRISNSSVMVYTPGGLKAVGTGEAVVEVYEVGQNKPLCKGTVNAYRRNRISSITVSPTQIRMCVGETAKIRCRYEPADADNTSSMKLDSQNTAVCDVLNLGTIRALHPGTTGITCGAERVSSNRCEVIVYPKLENIEITMDNQYLQIGSRTSVHIRRCPDDAKLDKLTVRIEPTSLGTYEIGTGRFFARESGSGLIIVESDRGAKSVLPVSIEREPLLSKRQIIKCVAAAIGAIALCILIISIM